MQLYDTTQRSTLTVGQHFKNTRSLPESQKMAANSRTRQSGGRRDSSSSSSLRAMILEEIKNDNINDSVASALYWGNSDSRLTTNNINRDTRLLVNNDNADDDDADNSSHNIAEHVLNVCGDLLLQANDVLDDVDEDMLGSAIQRGCTDLANVIGNLAYQLENQSEDERRELAQACLQDVNAATAAAIAAAAQQQDHDFFLLQQTSQQQQPPPGSHASTAAASTLVEWQDHQHELSTMNESQLVQVIVAAGCFLRDVEETLRAVEQDEAQELADVALTVAKIFVASLQSMHAQLRPQDLLITTGSRGVGVGSSTSTVRIELLGDDDDDYGNDNDGTKDKTATTRNARNQQSNNKQHRKKQMNDRLRVIWPPLGPAVSKAMAWGKDAAMAQPLFAIALATILWPAAVTTAIIGAPLVIIDGFIQDMYGHFQDVPLIVGLERGAAQLFHTGKLTLVTGKVVGRHSLKVVKRQIDRNGGIGHIVTNVVLAGMDRIMHPMETIGWSVEQIKRLSQHFTDQERETTAQVLQQ